MTDSATAAAPFSGRTAWARNLEAPLRDFLRTETGSAAILLAGMLALVGRRFPDSLRAFILTVAVADDLLALVVIVAAYSGSVQTTALIVGIGTFALAVVVRNRRVHNGAVYVVIAAVGWVAFLKS